MIAILLLPLAESPQPLNRLEQVKGEGVLRVSSRLGPLSYYERDGEPGGLSYNLLSALAVHLGVDLEIELYESLEEQMQSVYYEQEPVHIAAGTLTATASRLERYEFSEPYLETASILIQHSSRKNGRPLSDIFADDDYQMTVIADSSHAETLRKLNESDPDLPLNWQEEKGTIMFELLERVQQRQLDYSVVDSVIYDLERSMFPKVEIARQLTEAEPVGLVMAKDEDRSLVNAVNQFIRHYEKTGQLAELKEAYFEDLGRLDVAGALLFRQRLRDRLPEFEPLFRETAQRYDYDWLLLAAQAYQESHWEPNARSPTGVRGLMMLTRPTARQLKVKNRLDPEQSLDGGLRYLRSLKKRLPDRIQEPDRTKFALAAYNVGYGHLEDARILTERAKLNPDTWEDVQKHLPLLRQRKYYSTLKYGYARGNEPVQYVNNIYRFKSILDWHAWQQELNAETLIAQAKEQAADEEDAPIDVLDPSLAPL